MSQVMPQLCAKDSFETSLPFLPEHTLLVSCSGNPGAPIACRVERVSSNSEKQACHGKFRNMVFILRATGATERQFYNDQVHVQDDPFAG